MDGLDLFDSGAFTQMQRIAEVLADSTLLPEHLRGVWKTKPKKANNWVGEWLDHSRDVRIANAMLVVNAARLWGCDPFQLASHSYVVGGKLDFEGQVYAALVNYHGGLAEPLIPTYEGEESTRAVTISGRLSHEAEPRTIELTLLKAQTKSSGGDVTAQWRKDVDQMLFYAGARKWVRRHCPQVLLGLVTVTEQEAEPLAVIDHAPAESQKRLAEMAPTQDFTQYMAQLDDCEFRHQAEALSLSALSSKVLRPDERQQVAAKGRLLWPKLPEADRSDDPSEAFTRWERTFKTELNLNALVESGAKMDADESLTPDEHVALEEMLKACVAQLKPKPVTVPEIDETDHSTQQF